MLLFQLSYVLNENVKKIKEQLAPVNNGGTWELGIYQQPTYVQHGIDWRGEFARLKRDGFFHINSITRWHIAAVGVVLVCIRPAWTLAKWWWRGFVKKWTQRIITFAVDKFRVPPRNKIHELRTSFRNSTLPKISAGDPTHSHPASAAWRSSCMTLAQTFARKVGMLPFSYQGSTIDVRDGIDYSRDYHWAKDVLVPSKLANIQDDHLVVIVDVDYYLELPEFLLSTDQPVLLYTFQPHVVATSKGEFAFCFDRDNEVHYSVSGGANYHHKVWNYGVDVLTVWSWWKAKTFLVERRQANEHHEYVLLIPIGTWNGPAAWFARCLHTDVLQHLEVCQGDFAVMDVQDKKNIMRSIARIEEYNCATIPIDVFQQIAAVVRNSSVKVGNATVQSWLDNNKEQAVALVDYFHSVGMMHKPMMVYPMSKGIRKYQLVQKISDFEPDHKALMVPFMSPVLPLAFVPARGRNNEAAAIEGRIKEPAIDSEALQKRTSVLPSKKLIGYMVEFVDLLVPIKHQGHPVDLDEVSERQNRPSQQLQLAQADGMAAIVDDRSKTFLKAEPYQKLSDPRIITTYPTITKREYSRYIYALSKHISKFSWYAFGKTPRQIAHQIAQMCSRAKISISCADAVRQDGHVSSIARDLERMILVAYFDLEHLPEVTQLHELQYGCRAVTTEGLKYMLDFHRGSGSPETASFNTVLTKFCDYVARRNENSTIEEAFNADGLFGGDDSAATDVNGAALEVAGAWVGQRIENVEFLRGETGVNFLSRFYDDKVWFGDENSTCDIARALAKLHVTAHLNGLTPLEKLAQKLAGYALTDSETPVFAEVIRAARRVGLPIPIELHREISSWWSRFELDENWPNACRDEADVINRLLGPVDTQPLFKYLDDCKTPDDLLKMPCIINFDVVIKGNATRLAVVDDQVIEPNPKAIPALNDEYLNKLVMSHNATDLKIAFGPKKIDMCWNFVDGNCKDRMCKLQHLQICRAYLDNKCQRQQCKFQHVKRSAGPIVGPRP